MKPSSKATCGQDRTSASQAVGRGFDPRLPLQSTTYEQSSGPLTVRQNRYALGDNLAILFCPAPNGKMFGVTIDKADLPRVLAAGVWRVRLDGNTVYVRRSSSAHRRLLHHFILPGYALIDHKNRRGTDNRKANLRPATRSQNSANSLPRTGFKGVTLHKDGKYQSCIKSNGTSHYLGLFADAADAARAYDAKAKEAFGEFAYLNFPESAS